MSKKSIFSEKERAQLTALVSGNLVLAYFRIKGKLPTECSELVKLSRNVVVLAEELEKEAD